MTKPNFTAVYPITFAAFAAPARNSEIAYGLRAASKFIPLVLEALEAGEVVAPQFKSIKEAINRFVNSAFKTVIEEKYYYTGKSSDLPDAIRYEIPSLYEARLIRSVQKRIAKQKTDHPFFADVDAFLNEIAELQDVVEYLKSVTVSTAAKRESVKVQKEREATIRNQTDVVYQTVLPLKLQAQDRAEQLTRERIAACVVLLESAGMDLNLVAPFPEYVSYQNSRTPEYKRAEAKNIFYRTFTSYVDVYSNSNIMVIDYENIEKLVQRARHDAGLEFEAFVAKLNAKINSPVTEAVLAGDPWTGSTLTVTTTTKGVQVWNTQMIVNCSKYNKLFNQFPTRLAK